MLPGTFVHLLPCNYKHQGKLSSPVLLIYFLYHESGSTRRIISRLFFFNFNSMRLPPPPWLKDISNPEICRRRFAFPSSVLFPSVPAGTAFENAESCSLLAQLLCFGEKIQNDRNETAEVNQTARKTAPLICAWSYGFNNVA